MSRVSLVLVAFVALVGCGKAPLQMNKAQAAEYATRMSRLSGGAAFKAATPADVIDATARCDEGGTVAIRVTASASSMGGSSTATASFSITGAACKYKTDDGRLWTMNGGPITSTYSATGSSSGANMSMLALTVNMNGGPITVETDTERGSVQYDNLKIVTNVDTSNNSFRLRSVISGSMTVDGVTYSYTDESFDFRYTIDLNP
ncbi:MAG: hypothetical protein IAE78_17395 [Myxococcus sp.]|nr:hypothetical protein [Myxococcus sp.]